MENLAESRHFRLEYDPARSLVRWTRTRESYDDLGQFEDVLHATLVGLLRIERARTALLVDLRDGPMRNDDDFEVVALRFRREVHQGFARSAVLVRSRAGALQIARHGREQPQAGAGYPTFLSEPEALAYLSAR